jgi:hypothetical protein
VGPQIGEELRDEGGLGMLFALAVSLTPPEDPLTLFLLHLAMLGATAGVCRASRRKISEFGRLSPTG